MAAFFSGLRQAQTRLPINRIQSAIVDSAAGGDGSEFGALRVGANGNVDGALKRLHRDAVT
jgi:hypothetical protein